MYIRLGNTKINYKTPEYDDLIIFSEVPDIYMSYEKPILIHTKDELDIWVGKNFKERNYFDELLLSGVTLFIYKPISGDPNKWQEDYIDYSLFNNIEHQFYVDSNFPFKDSKVDDFFFSAIPEVGSDEIIYKIIADSGKYDVGFGGLKYNKFIWLVEQGSYINVEDLAQNIRLNSKSALNRDTLRLCKPGNDVEYCYPAYGHEYSKRDYTEFYFYNGTEWTLMSIIPNNYNFTASSLKDLKSIVINPVEGDIARINYQQSNKIISTTGINLGKIEEGYQTYAYSYKIEGTQLEEGDYIILKDYQGNYVMIKHGTNTVDTKYYSNTVEVSTVDDLISNIEKLGYKQETNLETGENLFVSDFPSPVTYFYHMSCLNLTPSFDETQDILTDYTENNSRIEFWSKTLGTDGPESNIRIDIEKLGTDYYRATITRFNYSEVYEGYLFKTREERLDYVISKNSKLVYCKLNDYWINSEGEKIKYQSEDEELPEGSWVMRRAWKESYTTDYYKTSMDKLFNSTIAFDFFLIPNIDKYNTTLDSESQYYKIYTDIIDLATNKDCQVLIENNSTNYTYNYTKDTYNRLVYFYNNMYVGNGYYRPGYYIFLWGLIKDNYSATTDNIVYDTPTDPTTMDVYNDTTDLIKELESKKSNYLIDNGLEYYYKIYFSGSKPVNTVLQRFVLSKITRELEKHKWNFLGNKMSGSIQTKIQYVLDGVSSNFTIIRSISISSLELDYYNNKIDLSLDTKMSDLIKNDISLDITLNFNKELWQQ